MISISGCLRKVSRAIPTVSVARSYINDGKTPRRVPGSSIVDLYENVRIRKDRFGYIDRPAPEEAESEVDWKADAPLPAPPRQHALNRNMRKPQNQSSQKLIQYLQEDREKLKAMFEIQHVHKVEAVQPALGLLRTGVIGRKHGTTTLFFRDGSYGDGTIIEIPENIVLTNRPWYGVHQDQNNLRELKIVAFDHEALDEVPLLTQKEYYSAGVSPKQAQYTFYVSPECALPEGYKLDLAHFSVGQYVDLHGVTINRGFQGVMRRWGYKGQGFDRGRTKTHRRPGSISTQGLARVLKGKKLAGIMGNQRRTLPNIQIVYANYERNYIIVKGTTLGAIGDFLYLADAQMKAPIQAPLLFYPTYIGPRDVLGTEVYDPRIIRPDEALPDLLSEKLGPELE